MSETTCFWKPDEDGVFHTDCGKSFFFDTAGPRENGFQFCPYCGDEIAAHPVN